MSADRDDAAHLLASAANATRLAESIERANRGEGEVIDDLDTLPERTDGPSFDGEESPATDPAEPDESMPKRRAADDDETRPLTLPDPDITVDRLGDKKLLELAIMASPDPLVKGRHLPSTRFAESIALCTDRTLRRYEAGERELPPLLREKCLTIVREAQAKHAKQLARKAAK